MYTAQPYAAAPGDMYAHAAAAAGFEGWAVAQQQHQAYVTLNRGMGHPTHMLQPHLAAAHGMGHPMLAQPQHHMMPGTHIGMVQQSQNAAAAAAPELMMTWAPQHVMPNMRPPTNGINSSHMVSQDMVAKPNWPASGGGGRGSNGHSSGSGRGMHTRQGSGGSGSGMLGGQQQQFFGNSGGRGRGRKNIVFNTKPGDFSDAAVEEFAWAVRRSPAGEALDRQMLSDGLLNLDSRGLAALLKELARGRHGRRARELFDFLRALPPDHQLSQLCDVFTYTAMVSLCVDQQELSRAFELVSEMRQRNVERNVHTYTALMNVAIKCGQLQKALEVYGELLREGCSPNVVTYNTLIDVHGKTGQWAEALKVIDAMNANNTKPVTRTYNTLMIACNTSGQWQKALDVYSEMVRMGHAPNTTTYNALISAHSKAGRLEKVMEVYQEMLRTGCERSVITYSALISACEKAGQWQLALNLFAEMLQERCVPNVITYNSLITACAQGAQWGKAAEVFEQMQNSGCKPDVVTYTALVSAYERGGQWMKALEAFQKMQEQRCNADAILYNTLLDVLWDTGVAWAQQKAGQLFRQAVEEGHFRQLPYPPPQQQQAAAAPASSEGLGAAAAAAPGSKPEPSSPSAASAASGGSPTAGSAAGSAAPAASASKLELGLQGVSPGVAMLMLHCWFADLRDCVLQQQQQQQALPDRVVVSTGRSRQRDHVSSILRDSTTALLASWDSPFAAQGSEHSSSSKLEASGAAVSQWLQQENVQKLLKPFASSAYTGKGSSAGSKAELAEETLLEKRCRDSIAAVKQFENTHNLSVQSMGMGYTAARAGLVSLLLEAGSKLKIRDDVAHDAVLLMDRAMSASMKVQEDGLTCLAAACLATTISSAGLQTPAPSLIDICAALGCCSSSEAAELQQQLQQALKSDTSATSALRCLKLYLERLGFAFQADGSCSSTQAAIADTIRLISRAAMESEWMWRL
ncbi:hypothetical protein OEZ86_009182 [Tetradesmus obliquus]|nr:hypothetical protein OEZ86_009182 [Tetradesmus obliquus]